MLLSDLATVLPGPHTAALFVIHARQRQNRLVVMPVEDNKTTAAWWVMGRDNVNVGDAPDKYHPAYLMAALSVRWPDADSTSGRWETMESLLARPIPPIGFTTDEWTRRSMTLNGMRMTTEYMASGSGRVLQLIEQRLAAGQSDVAHDVLVYLMRQVLDARAGEREARLLRAESVAAYLGLDRERVNPLFLRQRLSVLEIAGAIESGKAGAVRRQVDVAALIQNQIQHLRPALRKHEREEKALLELIDEIVSRLFNCECRECRE